MRVRPVWFWRILGKARFREIVATEESVRLQRIAGEPFDVPFRRIESLGISFGLFSREVRFSNTKGVEYRVKGLPARAAKQLFRLIETGVQREFENCHKAYEGSRSLLLQAGAKARALINRARFLNHGTIESWRKRCHDLQHVIRLRSDDLGLDKNMLQAVKNLRRLFDPDSDYVNRRNDAWVAKELAERKVWFDRCEQFPLTTTQREAILRDQDRCLVVAGAGTGKTSTVRSKGGLPPGQGPC